MGTMAQPLVSDELWEIVEPLIPTVERRHRYPGRKRIADRKVLTGILLACLRTAANRNDCSELVALVEAIPAVHGRRGRPKRRPASVVGDRGYQGKAASDELRRMRIKPLIAKQRTGHGSGLGRQRWVVERTLSWLHQHRRLRIRDA